MPGAYTSTPIVTTPPDVPDGWDPDWDFPPSNGPTPSEPGSPHSPGYTPDYSLNLSATESIAYNSAATATVTLRDHDTYGTGEPNGCSITWTATVGGGAVGLRFSGDEDYESNISSSYSEGVTYWGAAPGIEFELTADNVGDTVVLTAISTVSGGLLTETAEIEVSALSLTVTATFTLVGYAPGYEDENQYGHEIRCALYDKESGEPSGYVYVYAWGSHHPVFPDYPGPQYSRGNTIGDAASYEYDSWSLTLDLTEMTGMNCKILRHLVGRRVSVSGGAGLTLFNGETELGTYTEELAHDFSGDSHTSYHPEEDWVWLEIDGDTGAVIEN